MTLRRASQERAVVYFCLQPLAFPTYAESLGKLIVNDLKQLAAYQLGQSKPTPIYTVFDEFSLFAGEQVIHLINQGRSAGIHAVLATQSLSDLKRDDPALLGQVVSNCNNYLIQRQNNPEDADILANIIGTKDGFLITSQISTDQPQTGMGSARSTKDFIMHPDIIKRLAFGEAILVNKQGFSVERFMFRCSHVLKV